MAAGEQHIDGQTREQVVIGVEVEACFDPASLPTTKENLPHFRETIDRTVECGPGTTPVEFVSEIAPLDELLDATSTLRHELDVLRDAAVTCEDGSCHLHLHMSMDGCTKGSHPGFLKTLADTWAEHQKRILTKFPNMFEVAFSLPNRPGDYIANKYRILNIAPSTQVLKYGLSERWQAWHVEWRGFDHFACGEDWPQRFAEFARLTAEVFVEARARCEAADCAHCASAAKEARFWRNPWARDFDEAFGADNASAYGTPRSTCRMYANVYRVALPAMALGTLALALCLYARRRKRLTATTPRTRG